MIKFNVGDRVCHRTVGTRGRVVYVDDYGVVYGKVGDVTQALLFDEWELDEPAAVEAAYDPKLNEPPLNAGIEVNGYSALCQVWIEETRDGVEVRGQILRQHTTKLVSTLGALCGLGPGGVRIWFGDEELRLTAKVTRWDTSSGHCQFELFGTRQLQPAEPAPPLLHTTPTHTAEQTRWTWTVNDTSTINDGLDSVGADLPKAYEIPARCIEADDPVFDEAARGIVKAMRKHLDATLRPATFGGVSFPVRFPERIGDISEELAADVKAHNAQAEVDRYAAFREAVTEWLEPLLPPGARLVFDCISDGKEAAVWVLDATGAEVWSIDETINEAALGPLGKEFWTDTAPREIAAHWVVIQRAREAAGKR